MRKPSLLLLPALLVLSGCGDTATSGGGEREELVAYSEVAPAPPYAPAPASPPVSLDAGVAEGTRQAVASAGAGAQLPTDPAAADTIAVPAMIIRSGQATVQVDSLEPAIAKVRELAQRLGGYVANTALQGGRRATRHAMLEVKVPAERFDEALRGLRPLGEVESVNVTAQDVGEEFVDVSARMANARRLEERLVELLRTRTGRLEDVLAVERELARVREQIERYEGRLRYLRTRAAVSTLTVNLHEPYPVVGDYPGANPIMTAFRDAWRNFVGFVAAFIASLGILVPLAVILWLAWLVFRRVRAGRRRRTPPPPAADEPRP
ncbi:MAG TPA: DUF4349 domain-containing protein [Longimicrobiaceae bacterium]|nr:DUF4349 domain-containing protein [Longimicrobiaceae bacterium]